MADINFLGLLGIPTTFKFNLKAHLNIAELELFVGYKHSTRNCITNVIRKLCLEVLW
jgi:hypothetical protein